MINNSWCDYANVHPVKSFCSPDLEYLMVKCRPFWLPREFTAVIITAVYIPPQADTDRALRELYSAISSEETAHPEAAFITAGDFNKGNLKKVSPKLHQHIHFNTRGDRLLDHCYTPFQDAYKALLRSPFGQSDHRSILLLPAYRQKLKQEAPTLRAVHRWSDQSESTLRDCFDHADWEMFHVAANDIDEYTDSVCGFIRKCVEDVIPSRTLKSFPNQKPWINGDVRTALAARSTAFASANTSDYKHAHYQLRKTIKAAKREYRDRVEQQFDNSLTTATRNSNIIVKFADDTTVVGLITNGDETAYREEVSALTHWCQDNHLTLNVAKTKELIVDFRRCREVHTPITINGAAVERVSSFRFLGVHLAEDLTWSGHILRTFYRCAIESILTGCITTWYGNSTAYNCKALQRVVRCAERIIGGELPSLQDIYRKRCLRKAGRIIKDSSHPSHKLFRLLPSGRRFCSIRSRTSRLRDSFFHQAIRLLNTS
uniref:Reverse transcriptase domain-containing protein n=1 Tax=Oreochromis niloticus TaxID=8128 RepID=A0A669EKF5_ORENI